MSDTFPGSLRYAESAKRILDKAFAMKDVEAAVALIGSLVETAIQEISVVTRYNPDTGDVLTIGWKPYNAWDGRLLYGGMSGLLEKSHSLYAAITERIPVGKTLIVGNVAVRHMPEESVGDIRFGGTHPAYFQFMKSV